MRLSPGSATLTIRVGRSVTLDPRLVGDDPSLVRELVLSIAAPAFDEDLASRLAAIGESPGGRLPELPAGRKGFLQLAAKLVSPSRVGNTRVVSPLGDCAPAQGGEKTPSAALPQHTRSGR
jgi:hypothetical protein